MSAQQHNTGLSNWDYARRRSGVAYVLAEIQKLRVSPSTVAHLEFIMARVGTGVTKPGETTKLGKYALELRCDHDGRWYRLFYGIHEGRLIALMFVAKKSNRLSTVVLHTADARFEEHVRRSAG